MQVEYLECAGSNAVAVVKLKKPKPGDAKKALNILAEKFMGKMLVAVDEDIDIKDAENILWAIAYRAQPFRDVERGRGTQLPARSGFVAAGRRRAA